MRTWLRDVAILILVAASSLAQAQSHTATTTDAVNVRAGPDRVFPTVTWLLGGTTVEVVGCVAGWQWCDVIAGAYRGWVHARFLAYRHDGRQVNIAAGGPALGLPAIDFAFGSYWDDHYRDQRWYGRKLYWQERWQRRRPAPT